MGIKDGFIADLLAFDHPNFAFAFGNEVGENTVPIAGRMRGRIRAFSAKGTESRFDECDQDRPGRGRQI